MFKLTLGKTTGKQVVAMIDKAMKARRQKTGRNVTYNNFYESADISRNMIHRYKRGEQPGIDGLMKIAKGLRSWGLDVALTIDEGGTGK